MALKPTLGSSFDVKDHLGEIMAARQVRIDNIPTSYGPSDVAICGELAVQGEDQTLSVLTDVYIFGRALVRTLAAAKGDEWLIGKWSQGVAKPGQTAAWLIVEISDEETAAVEAALKAQDEPW
jgi:hypothetical protein